MNNKFLSISLLSLLSISLHASDEQSELAMIRKKLEMAKVNVRIAMINGHVNPRQSLSRINSNPVAAKMIGDAICNVVVTKVVEAVCDAVEKAITQTPASTPSPYVPTMPPFAKAPASTPKPAPKAPAPAPKKQDNAAPKKPATFKPKK
jgi:hypothetical protein